MRAKISHKLFMLVGESYSNMISHVFFERTAGRYIMSVTQRHSIALKCDNFFLSEPVAFRRVYGLESYSRTSGESNRHRKSVSTTRVMPYQLHREDDSTW